MSLCQSYAKNMGLCGEHVRAFRVVSKDAEEAKSVGSLVFQPNSQWGPDHRNHFDFRKQRVQEVKGIADRTVSISVRTQ